jgi:hypothetical protein
MRPIRDHCRKYNQNRERRDCDVRRHKFRLSSNGSGAEFHSAHIWASPRSDIASTLYPLYDPENTKAPDLVSDGSYPKPQVIVFIDCGASFATPSTEQPTEELRDRAVYFVIDKVNDLVNNQKMATETEYEKRIISDLSSGNFRFSQHFKNDRSESRSVSKQDIQRAAQYWADCWTENDPRGDVVHVVGPDLDGEEFEVRAGYDGQTLVITAVDSK